MKKQSKITKAQRVSFPGFRAAFDAARRRNVGELLDEIKGERARLNLPVRRNG